jgi:hypothetical protein
MSRPAGASSAMMKGSLWNVDLFPWESKLLRNQWVRAFMDVFTVGKSLPRHLTFDYDPLLRFHRWRADLRLIDGR